jgi:excisionase family DNA binding protein
MSEAKDTYTTAQAARILKVTNRHVRKLIGLGGLEGQKDASGHWRVLQRAVHARLDSNMDEQQRPPEYSWVLYGDGTAVTITQEGGCAAEWVLVGGEWQFREEGDPDLLELGFTFDPKTGLHYDPVAGDYIDTHGAHIRVNTRTAVRLSGERVIGFDGREWA